MIRLKILILVVFFHFGDFEGKVVAVIDGDTIEVLKEGRRVRVRLNAVDCPERTQAFGARAKAFTAESVFGKTVVVVEKELDRYGRTIADIYLQDGTWFNKLLIDEGMAWHYKRYSNDEVLAEAEVFARGKRIGLWRDHSPVPPWDYRRK